MKNSELTLPIEMVEVGRIDGYYSAVRALLEVLDKAEQEEGLWPRARCNAILADCRSRFVARMRLISQMDQSDVELGFDFLFDGLWQVINPAPHATHTELICRCKKARWVVIALERALSAMVVLDDRYPGKMEAIDMVPEDPDAL